ncbi:11757_t:CDS:2 [Acaulospora colombiana]|uniref:11757_t:CDS:1 n=1 Tax=Acaulospora colombiana TaxID=27376 RepID=A0ACA9N7B1_9GLOM|nr:11757_t:CDS:2 [Acaulospora colombiana]
MSTLRRNWFSARTSLFLSRPAGFSIFRQHTYTQRPALVNPKTYLSQRFYSADTTLSRSNIETRIIDILKSFDKVDPTKVTLQARFADDLGLDSLDTVEVVMNIEEDFSIEIPDKDADEIRSIKDAVDYISKREDAH